MANVPDHLSAAVADRYHIERELGEGGMATVYLAQDLRHRRRVAIKVLKPAIAMSLGHGRFLREIEVAARLTHPHILPLLDSGAVGTDPPTLFYVMPYIDGDSLRARIDRDGELPVADAIRIMREIADALASAHEHGVVHRDIKPDNVMLSGRHALVMDFGVAKAVSEATGSHTVTTAGVALGTPTYMAPEQATADPHLDHRVDIYALGAVGYEMLTGRPPFTGRTPQAVLAAHVTQAPDPLERHRPGVPSALADVIMKCLAKRPADRYQSAEEVLAELEPLVSGGTTPVGMSPASAAPPARRGRLVALAAMAVVLVLAAAALVVPRFRAGAPAPIELGRVMQVTLGPELDLDPALSPDGRLIAYASGSAVESRVFVRQIDGGTPREVAPGVAGPQRAPRWSPDGSQLLFTVHGGVDGGLHVVPALGGIPRLIVRAALPPAGATSSSVGVADAAWSPDGRSIVMSRNGVLVVHDLETGRERELAAPGAMSPAWSPDGRWIASSSGNVGFAYGGRYLGNIAPSAVGIIAADGSGEPLEIAGGGMLNVSPVWLGNDRLLFISTRDGARDIYAQRIDRRGRPNGAPERLTTGLDAHGLSLSADGSTLAYATFQETVNVWSVREPGSGATADDLRAETAEQQVVEGFDLSPDRQWIVFDSDRDGSQHIFRMPSGGGPAQQLTRGGYDDFLPAWSRDGREIAFHSLKTGARRIYVMPAGGGPATPATSEPGQDYQPHWSPGGHSLVYVHDSDGAISMRVVRRTSDGWAPSVELGRLPLIGGGFGYPAYSPDGRWVLYTELPRALAVPVSATPDAAEPPRVLFDRPDAAAFIAAWRADGAAVYLIAEDETGQSALWEVPFGGGEPRVVRTFDDPARQPTRFGMRVAGGRIYFTYGERRADVAVVPLAGRRSVAAGRSATIAASSSAFVVP